MYSCTHVTMFLIPYTSIYTELVNITVLSPNMWLRYKTYSFMYAIFAGLLVKLSGNLTKR